ncbi:urea ABC transporter permease subunit UrtC [Peribacillus asahii]|uniref:urea ABC transporter permease subunit UrtC n=1 Tax=Peribacillus asahii TaxID=228899 RepID=UPI0015FE14A8|nr:urea ABC transporter permease subunit UrtC [Peribacillus asahii]
MKNISRSSYALLFIFLLCAPLFLHDFRVALLAKFLCFAILAVGICLIWGYTGILSLGHGVFFGLGAYCVAMYLKLEASPTGIPDFMGWSGIVELPGLWKPFANPYFAISAAVIVPVLLALVLGYFTFKNRIRGVYFSLISQALVVVFVTLFIGKQEITGGTNGLTNFSTAFGISLTNRGVQQVLYFITVGFLLLTVAFALWLTKSRAGKLLMAIREGENRVRFLGYNPTSFKVFVYCVSAALAGVAGGLFVLQVGMISPEMMGIIPSIEMVLWVAVGGRYSIFGAVIGAILTNSAKSFFSESYPDFWLFFLGGLFILVVLVMPNGLVGLGKSVGEKITSRIKKKEKEDVQHEAGPYVS